MDDTSGLGPAMEQSWQRDQLARQKALAAQAQYAETLGARQLRAQAMEAALRSNLHDCGYDAVLEAARAYEAYLKGE